jgi:TonB family protein
MQSRDVTIPLALWMCAAICAHFLFGTGGLVVAKMHDDRSELWRLSREASSLTQRNEQTFELTLGEPSEDQKDEVEPAAPPKPAEPPKPAPMASQQPPEQPSPQAKRDEKRIVILKDAEKKPLILPEDPLKDRRIAVRQHAKPNSPDNPEAKFIADEANRVEKETVATQTSHDRDDENPTPGGNHPGSQPEPGDSERTRIAESAEHAGERNRAPGEKRTEFDVVREPRLPAPTVGATASSVRQPPAQPGTAVEARQPAQAPRPEPQPQPLPGGTTPASPQVENAPTGGWTFNPARPGATPGTAPQPSTGVANPAVPGGKLWSLSGLGQRSPPGTMNTNLESNQIASIVGTDSLRKLREADGERRKSEHRGSWVTSNFDRWRSAIENYISTVKPGNQTALNTAAVPFASYLNGMHNRIHPIFADSFLESLDSLPTNHPMNDRHLVTRLEIVLTKDGRLKKMGIVKTSGITAFDIAALDSVDRAQPFGPAPGAIVSPDGNVYLHWEFHRDEVYACSTMGARPFILNMPNPKDEEPSQPASPPTPSSPGKERGVPPSSPNDSREGWLPRVQPRSALSGSARLVGLHPVTPRGRHAASSGSPPAESSADAARAD